MKTYSIIYKCKNSLGEWVEDNCLDIEAKSEKEALTAAKENLKTIYTEFEITEVKK